MEDKGGKMSHKTKHLVYRMLWIATGALTATVVVGLISLVMVYNNIQGDWVVALYFLVLLMAGVLLGVICGRIAWNKVYVEGVRGDKYVKEHEIRIKEMEQKLFADLKGFDIDKAMKWTITIFLVYLMVIISVAMATGLVRYERAHIRAEKAIFEQMFTL